MTETVRLHHLAPSPNNIKIRIALAYKGIDYEALAVDRNDRSKLLQLTRQPLTPVLEHGDRAIFDSGAILRYLEANFQDSPRLFASERNELKAIEEWERHHMTVLGPPLGQAFGVMFSTMFGAMSDGEGNPTIMTEASQALNEQSKQLEQHLEQQQREGSDWIVGDQMTAADIVNGSFLAYACFDDGLAAAHPIWAWFREHFHLGEGRDHCRALAHRVTRYLTEAN